MKTILVVDDEQILRENICAYLENAKYNVIQASDGLKAIELFNLHKPDLIILDLMLPNLSGEDVCLKIRKVSNVPIIMLTAKTSEDSVINGLNIGADNYISKPFSVKELVARVNSLIRRFDNFDGEGLVSYNNGDLQIDYSKRLVYKKGVLCTLTKTEFDIIEALSKFSKKVFSREDLLELTTDGFDSFDRVVDTHIKNLRKKIEDKTSSPTYIITVRGVGYKFGGELV